MGLRRCSAEPKRILEDGDGWPPCPEQAGPTLPGPRRPLLPTPSRMEPKTRPHRPEHQPSPPAGADIADTVSGLAVTFMKWRRQRARHHEDAAAVTRMT
jgi:hypothetical protein